MILNVSGRTDIIAFYTPWFISRYKEGFIDVRNPFYKKNVSRIYFNDVDLIVFCTKNPLPIIPYLNKINKPIIFHVTLTPYKKDIEPNVIDKNKIIMGIKKISKILGKNKVVLRYDPIFLSSKYDVNYHIKAFSKLCRLLNGYIDVIIVSFMDIYKNVLNNKDILKYRDFSEDDYKIIGEEFSKVAEKYNITVQTCSENRNLFEYGFIPGECLSYETAYQLTGKKYKRWTSRNNKFCHCVEMVDIGVYNTCRHFCKYCYANFDEKQVNLNIKNHDPKSSLLIGHLEKDDIVKRKS